MLIICMYVLLNLFENKKLIQILPKHRVELLADYLKI